jgi:nucleoside-diphosphate-sugar epimerase
MRQLFCLGLGYSARAYIHRYGAAFDGIAATAREPSSTPGDSLATVFRYTEPWLADLADALAGSTHLLISAPPARCAEAAKAALRASNQLQSIVYLSSVSVYGNADGGEVDENSPLHGDSARARERIAAEKAWQDFGDTANCPVAVLRLAGIYGPGRNALVNVANGEARTVIKSEQVFNRIHVEDIAQAIDAGFSRRANGVFNLADNEPAPPQDVIFHAADLLGLPRPAAIPFEQAKETMSPMARSFYADNKRIVSRKIKYELGVELLFPDYRSGLAALHRNGEGTRRA